MRTTNQQPVYKYALLVTCTAGLMLAKSAIAHTGTVFQGNVFTKISNPAQEEPVKKKKINTKRLSGKRNAVRIYREKRRNNLHVVAKKNDHRVIDFFVFDLEGTLIHNYRMIARDHTKISGLKKGIYIYRVFTGDEETTSGEIEIN